MAKYSTLYGHGARGSVRVKVGDVLKKGDEIFEQGNTGISTGPHLHLTRIPGERSIHWSGNQTIGLGGTEADILKFLNADKIYKTKQGFAGHIITAGWYGYDGHGAVDTVSSVGTRLGGTPIVVWNQDYNGKVIGVHDYGSSRTGVTVIVLSGYEEKTTSGSTTGGSVGEYYTIKSGDTLWGITGGDNAWIEQIKADNPGIDPHNLSIGQKIKFRRTVKTVVDLAKEVLNGDWGVGADREKRLTKAGYNYIDVQNRVNYILNAIVPLKLYDKVKVKTGATTFTGGNLASFVYSETYKVLETEGDRIVIGKDGEVTAAVHIRDIVKV